MTRQTLAQQVTAGQSCRLDMQRSDWLAQAFRTEALSGLKLATQGRLVSLAVIAVLLVWLVPTPGLYYFEALLLIFVGLGIIHYWFSRSHLGQSWQDYVFVVLDFALLTFAVFVPNPLALVSQPPQMALRTDPIVYYFLLIAARALSYSPRLMLWAGLTSGLCWSAGVLWLLSLPDTLTQWQPSLRLPAARHLDPHFVNMDLWLQDLVLLLLVAWVLAAVVRRSRLLVVRQATVARERANLARYFSPNVLDEVTGSDAPLATVRKHEVAILFADIVGFTRLCETMPPEHVMAFLREFHARIEAQVFRFGGTLDKFIGDAVMASFGAPRPGAQDATSALRCARAILHAMAEWNRHREATGEVPIRIGIGLHYGPAVIGDVGSERCAAFAVIGDTTNTTSRLQTLTRHLQADIVASQTLLEAVYCETPQAEAELRGFADAGRQAIRGRQNAIHVWTLTAGSDHACLQGACPSNQREAKFPLETRLLGHELTGMRHQVPQHRTSFAHQWTHLQPMPHLCIAQVDPKGPNDQDVRCLHDHIPACTVRSQAD